MRAYVWTAAAVTIFAGVLVGCSNTTTGTLARTTEPGAPLTTSRSPAPSTRPTATALPTLPSELLPAPHSPTVPAPANSTTMTCTDYGKLDDETKLAVVAAILATQPEPVYDNQMLPIFKAVADVLCPAMPTVAVSEAVMGGGLPK